MFDILLDEDTQWPPRFIDGAAKSGIKSADHINRFRNDLKNGHITSFFENPDQLSSRVVSAVNKTLEELKQKSMIESTSTISANSFTLSSLLGQKPSYVLFKGEKSFFVGREEYINKIIKDQIKAPSSRVCIIGPGGSGKSQLAFKAIHQYEKEGLFDLVIPVYFSDVSTMSFSAFLSNIAKSFLDLNQIGEFEKLEIEQRKTVIYNYLAQKKHPLLFLDNYETVSYILNDREKITAENSEDARKISYYLNNEIPSNTSVLVTSRETYNNFENKEKKIHLAGLQKQETIELFAGLTSTEYLQNIENILNNPTARSAIEKIFIMTGGHPLSIEIIAKNISNIHEIQEMADTRGLEIVNPNEPDQRLRSLEACFDYTIKKLPNNIKKLLYHLTLCKSPFPSDVAKEIFNDNIKSIYDLYKRSLLLEIKSETSFGEIKNPDYWLYSIHPAIRNYLEKTIQKAIGKTISDLEEVYGVSFFEYYYDLISNIYKSIGKENHRDSLAQFNLISQGKENDFERSILFLQDKKNEQKSAYILSYLGLISKKIGLYTKAEGYFKRSINLYDLTSDRGGLARDFKNIGNVYSDMGKYEQSLEYYNKAWEIDTELNHKERLAGDYANIGEAYSNMRNYTQSIEYYNKALEIYTELNNRVGLAELYKYIGRTYTNDESYTNALEYYNKALEIDTELNDRIGLAKDHHNISFPLSEMNRKEQSLEHLSTAKTILLDFQKETEYSHPLLKEVEDRFSSLNQDKK